MARKQSKTKAKKPQVNAAKNKSSSAGKRREQQPKAAGKSASSKPATAKRKPATPPKRKNVSQTIPNGRTLQTRDEYIGEENKNYRKPGYERKGKYRKVVVVDSNRNDELAVVKLTTSDRAIPINDYNGKSRYKPFVEIKDCDGQPIKTGKRFKENSASADVPKSEVAKIKKRCFKTSKQASKNREAVRELKGRKKSTE